jgi:ferredoxin
MKIVLHTSRCIGAGACALAAEDLFTLSNEGVVELIGEPDEARAAQAQEAAMACPTGAIEIIEG